MKPIVLVTGASAGIGRAVAIKAAQQGYAVGINYCRQQDKAAALQQELETMGAEAVCLQADVSQEDQVMAMFDTLDKQLGTLTALVNNAGIISPLGSFETVDQARLDRIFSINVTGSFLCAREAIKRMASKHGGKGGAIVNLSSVAASLGSPNEFIDYAATKGAIDTLTKGLAKEMATENIRVNAVRPGLIATDIHAHAGDAGRPERLKSGIPMQRAGSAEEIADAVIWLLSEEASYITGSLLDVSGGR